MELTMVHDLTPVINRELNGGVQAVFRFDNGYGASVVRHQHSYGVELGVAKFTGEDPDAWELCYTTPITDDVIGYIEDEDELFGYLTRIRSLPMPIAGAESVPDALEDADEDEDTWTEELGPYATEEDAHADFDDMLNECYGTVSVAGMEFETSRALKELDPIAYRCSYIDWLDGEIENSRP